MLFPYWMICGSIIIYFYHSYLFELQTMTQRKAWTQQEDRILKDLYEEKNIKKWSEIARIMESEHQIKGRNGKQCRQRYHNHLDNSIKHCKWTEEEEKELMKHHNQIGNKWAQISKYLEGRSENDIKNQFYSVLRRGLRRINLIIRRQLKRYKQLQISTLYKIVQACQEGHRTRSKGKSIDDNVELKQTIIRYSFNPTENLEDQINNVKEFIEKYKRTMKVTNKPKKGKGNNEENQRQSDIESAEYRDDCPVQEIKKQEPDQKFRKNSFFNFTLEAPQLQFQMKNQIKSTQYAPYKLRKRSSFCSNHSFDISSPKWNDCADPFSKNFQLLQTDNFSPRPTFYATSPYFDQFKSNNSLWNQNFHH